MQRTLIGVLERRRVYYTSTANGACNLIRLVWRWGRANFPLYFGFNSAKTSTGLAMTIPALHGRYHAAKLTYWQKPDSMASTAVTSPIHIIILSYTLLFIFDSCFYYAVIYHVASYLFYLYYNLYLFILRMKTI